MNVFLKMMLKFSLRQYPEFQSNSPTNYQSDFSLSPRHWLNKNYNFANDILVFENEIFKNIFSPYRYMIQKNIISKSKKDLTSITENTDIVYKFLEIYSMVMSQQNTRRKNQASNLER